MTHAPTPDDPHGAKPTPESLTVLYIEDNAVNAALMAGLLDMLPGVRMLHAAHPEDGLALARSGQPALVLVDIQMPGMDGYEVLR
jgi:CheY-like chemotaxis protein